MSRLVRDKDGNILRDERGCALIECGVTYYDHNGKQEYFPQDHTDETDQPVSSEMKESLDWMCDTLDEILGIEKEKVEV